MTMEDRSKQVEQRILAACERSGRRREDIQLIAVTKYVSIETAKEAFQCGYQHLGENRWQDAKSKWQSFAEQDRRQEDEPIWHFIGSLQTNKVKEVLPKFTYIHSLDRLSLAETIHKKAMQLGIVVPCFIQVNVSGEQSKHGMEPNYLSEFLNKIQEYDGIQAVGLMTMAPHEASPEDTRDVFRQLREIMEEQQKEPSGVHLTQLSMGMSNDFEIAIEEGATWIRLGTVLVGKEEE